MKIDINKKHPFTSVDIIPEGKEDEYLTEEETKEIKKIALRCIRLIYCSIFFTILSFICEFVDLNDLFSASKSEKILAFVGYFDLLCLIILIVLIIIEGRKLNYFSKKHFTDDNF